MVDVTKLKIDSLLTAHEDLPTRLKMAIDPMMMILDAVPDHIMETAERTYKERMQDQIDEYFEKHGEPEYDTTTLRNMIAKRLSTAPPAGRALDSTNAFVAAGDKKGGTRDDGGKRAERLKDKRITGVLGKIITGKGSAFHAATTFSFITPDDGGEAVFCHSSDADFEMDEGDQVEFGVTYSSAKGKDKAVKVRRVAHAAAVASDQEMEYDASSVS